MLEIAVHRGGNSWSDLYRCIQDNCDYAELDVHMSQDHYLIVQYSAKICVDERWIPISEISYSGLPDCVKKKVILLSDIFAYSRGKIKLILDIKCRWNNGREISRILADMIAKYDMCDHVWAISFDHQCLVDLKERNPMVRIAPMYVAKLYSEEHYWTVSSADGVEICSDYLDGETVNQAHAMDLTVIGWCTEDLSEIKRMRDIGIDIITIELKEEYFKLLTGKEETV